MPHAEAWTTSSTYKIGANITVKNNDSAHTECTVTIQPLLLNTQGVTRRQHNWHVHFALDAQWKYTRTYGGTGAEALPNDTAASGVVSAGQLRMTKNTWYNWGSSWSIVVPNDGGTHYIGVRMECVGTVPRGCPATDYLYVAFVTGTYQAPVTPEPEPLPTPVTPTPVYPPAPSGLYTTFDPITRTLSYYWNDASCIAIKLWRNLLDVNQAALPGSGFISPNPSGNIYNVDKPVTEVLPENVAYVTYQMTNYSSTGHTTASPGMTATWSLPDSAQVLTQFPTGNRVWINVNNNWKKAVVWINTNYGKSGPAQWKMVQHVYVRKPNGAWEIATM